MVKRESERNSRVGRTRCLCCDGDGWEEGGSDDSEQEEEEEKDDGGGGGVSAVTDGRKAGAMTASKGRRDRGMGEENENEQRARVGGREGWGGGEERENKDLVS